MWEKVIPNENVDFDVAFPLLEGIARGFGADFAFELDDIVFDVVAVELKGGNGEVAFCGKVNSAGFDSGDLLGCTPVVVRIPVKDGDVEGGALYMGTALDELVDYINGVECPHFCVRFIDEELVGGWVAAGVAFAKGHFEACEAKQAAKGDSDV